MTFLKRLDSAINNDRHRRGLPMDKVMVNDRDLRELIHNFEKLDSEARLDHSLGRPDTTPSRHLELAIISCWHSSGDKSDQVTEVFSRVVSELYRERMNNNPMYKPIGKAGNI